MKNLKMFNKKLIVENSQNLISKINEENCNFNLLSDDLDLI